MMRYDIRRYHRGGAQPGFASRGQLDGYRFSLFAPPAVAGRQGTSPGEAYTVRAVTPSLRPLMRRHNGRCPECTGPLVSGEACVACPVCGFRRLG